MGLVGGAVYLGWIYATWEPTAPEPQSKTTTIKIPAGEQDRARPGATATTEISGGRFEITLPIPETLPRTKPKDKAPAEPAQPVETAKAETKVGPTGVVESDLQDVLDKPEARTGTEPAQKPEEKPGPTLADLKKPLVVGDLTIPPPGAVPAFDPGQKPAFVLETELQGRTVAVRGRTNLAVDGNGVQISLFRVFKETGSGEAKRASLETRNLPLRFAGSFQVDDREWLRARQENEQQNPAVFPALSYLDRERVQVEVLLTGTRKDLGPVPGLTVYPIPGTDKQVYRIIRSVSLPIPKSAQEPAPVQKIRDEQPAAPAPAEPKQKPAEEKEPRKTAPKQLRKPGGPTRIRINPLKWVDGPVQAFLIHGDSGSGSRNSGSGDLAQDGGSLPLSPLVLAYRF